jgi:hypothetical protein
MQVVYFRPAHIVKFNMNKYIDIQYRIAFQSSCNEGILHLMKMSSKKVGYHVENSTQVTSGILPANQALPFAPKIFDCAAFKLGSPNFQAQIQQFEGH